MADRLTRGDKAPDFTVDVSGGDTFTLSDHQGKKVIVYFYPAAMTPGCTTQACDFEEKLSTFTDEGYVVIGISPDPVDKLDKFTERDSLSFFLGSDPKKTVLEQYGAFGEKTMYGKKVVGVIRSTIVVDEEGAVTHAAYNVRAKGHVAKLRRDLGLSA